MKRIATVVCAACMALSAATTVAAPPKLSVAQIIDRNIEARGGSEAWRKIQTMVWLGHINTGQEGTASFPFVLQMQRPNKTRFDIRTNNQLSARIFDGMQGWTVRSVPMKRPSVQPFSAIELRAAHDAQGIDGPLLDYQTKHIEVALEAIEPVDGQPAYRLNVKLPSGTSHHEWIDTTTFLEVKSDRESRNAFGMTGRVLVTYRNYRSVDSVKVPTLIESGGNSSSKHETMFIDRVLINPKLDKQTFSQPERGKRQQPHQPPLRNKHLTATAQADGSGERRK